MQDSPRATRANTRAAEKEKANVEVKPKAPEDPDSGHSSDGSDEYNPDVDKAPKRRVHRQSYQSEDESDSDATRSNTPKRLRKGNVAPKEPTLVAPKQHSPSPSTSTSTQAKRKKSTAEQTAPPAKRPRSESTAGEDAARKYCLTKLQELFCRVFTRYPFLRQHDEAEAAPSDSPLLPEKKSDELTPEEKEQLETKAKKFGIDLEQCMYELYSEPDKQGKHIVAAKYKERFRMLTFNLSKADRVILHMRIASSRISPKELSTMSSTDLASEEEKQSIKKLEEEALAHSILKKATVPRAKITHKGLQDIEDVTGAGQREAEREREEDERIERERLARLRLQALRAQSQGSAPPESPVVATPTSATWGAPPPVPLHAAPSADHGSQTAGVPLGRPPTHPPFVPSASDFTGASDNELNLADLINIDEEASGEVAMTPVDTMPTPFGENPPLLSAPNLTERASQPTPSPLTPTHTAAAGISPFAAKSSQLDASTHSSFDLNALWTPGPADAPDQGETEPQESTESTGEDQAMEVDMPGDEAEDRDFDMFLNNNEQEEPKEEQVAAPEPVEMTSEEKRAAFDAQDLVWIGTLSMPLDSAIPQEVAVVARQAGGRTMTKDSPLWRTLFPSMELRIDGRVPVEKSAQYLTQVRLNPSKELVAVAFCPTPGFDSSGFHALKNHLLAKGRHGLIFPWGHNPKSSAPGRELYVVPLLSSDTIPEYMELLDQLRLPRERTVDYLVGIWVLTKGKLVVPAQPATATPAVAPSPPPSIAPTAMPNLDFAQLQQLGLQTTAGLGQPQAVPNTNYPPTSGSIPPPSALATAPTSAAPAPNLAAEIATLTPEQIQIMLQTLTKTTPQPGSFPQPPPAAPQGVPFPSTIPPPPGTSQPIALPSAALQPWTNPSPAPAQYPPLPPPSYSQPPSTLNLTQVTIALRPGPGDSTVVTATTTLHITTRITTTTTIAASVAEADGDGVPTVGVDGTRIGRRVAREGEAGTRLQDRAIEVTAAGDGMKSSDGTKLLLPFTHALGVRMYIPYVLYHHGGLCLAQLMMVR
ncbi:hypothetical protein C8Q80DRAFT_143618 [Daedaleopsis nitida]|nr:hypothetical protein C8Q80DRAFT_143618 [Daedaleopsis nitida]